MAIPDTSTPTIQEILQSYQQGVGAGGVNTTLLIQALKERQRRAVEEDTQTAKAVGSGGKAFLSGSKHARDFQIAQRVKPDLSFAEFMRDPATSAKYVKKGTELIASGKRAPLGFGEAFNPFSKRHLRNPNIETLSDLAQADTRSKLSQELTELQPKVMAEQELLGGEFQDAKIAEMQEALHQRNLQDLAGAQESIGGAIDVASGADVNLAQPYIPPAYQPPQLASQDPSGISGLSAQDAISKLRERGYSGDLASIRGGYGDLNLAGQLKPSVRLPESLASATRAVSPPMSPYIPGDALMESPALAQSVFQQQQPFNPFSAGPSSLKQGLAPISTGAEVSGTAIPEAYSNRLGLGALGKASNVYGVGKGLQEISEGGGDLSTVSGTAGSLAALAGLHPLVAGGLGALSYLSRR